MLNVKSYCDGVGPGTVVMLGLAGFGLLRVLSHTQASARFLWRKYLRSSKKHTDYGEWALVTGASDGIGREYCNYLARQGLNIFLVSRTQSKLETAQAEIAQEHGVKTKILAVDLAEAGAQPLSEAVWADLKATIDTLDIGVLINNAAKLQGPPEEFHKVDPGSLDSTVSLNIVAVLKITHLVLPGMVDRGRGAIVSVSSILAIAPAAPFWSLYIATKAFLDSFSKSIAAEYGPKGIDVQVHSSGPVATSLVNNPENVMSPSAAKFVTHAGRHIGYETLCYPYSPHAVTTGILQAMPHRMAISVVKGIMKEISASMEASAAKTGKASEVWQEGELSAEGS